MKEIEELKKELKKVSNYIGYMEDRQGFCGREYKDLFWELKKKIEELEKNSCN